MTKRTRDNNGRGWWYKFSDGYECWVRGMSRQELAVEEQKHGKLVSRDPA